MRKWSLQERKAFGEMMAQRRAAKTALLKLEAAKLHAEQLRSPSIEVPLAEQIVNVPAGQLSKTDQKFWSLRPGFYDFCKDGEWRRRCENCDESFQTRLEFNSFCSPNCRNAFLSRHETRGA